MKKFIYLPIMAAAALMAYSCVKSEMPEQNHPGTLVYIDLDEVVIGGEDEPESKVIFNSTETVTEQGKPDKIKYNFAWEAGDAFKIFSFNYDADKLLDWGQFVTKSGGKWGRFYGYIPYGFNPDDYTATIAVHCQNLSDFTLNKTTTAGKYELKFNLPSEQDGSGVRYCVLAPNSNPKYAHFKVTRTVDEANPEDVSKWTYAFSGSRMFKSCTALSKLVVPAEADIKTIRVTVSHAIRDNFTLASSGIKADMSFNCLPSSFGAISGGGSKTITINDGGETLTEVYFASRQTNGDNTNGYATLTFEFVDGEGKVATKKAILATNPDPETGKATSYSNLSTYNVVHDFGTVTFAEGDFKEVNAQ